MITNKTLLIIFSLIYVVGLSFVYFSKVRINNMENKIYKTMLIANIIGLILQICCDFISFKNDLLPQLIMDIIYKLYLVYFIVFINLMLLYLIIIISKLKSKLLINVAVLFIMLESVIVTLSPYSLYRDVLNKIYYTYGPAIDLTFIISGVTCLIMFLVLIINFNKVSKKKSIPIYLLIVSGIISAVVQNVYPDIIIIASMESFICCLMYFTIENPDLKMLESYHNAKEYAEDLNIEKQMFIYNISQDMKIPLLKTSKYCEDLLYSDDLNTYKNGIRSIKSECNSMIQKINSIYDIDIDDVKNIDTDNTKYNLYNLLKLITSNMQKDIESSDKKIQLITSIDDTLPKELIGDITRLKEVLNKLFKLAIKNTTEGFIEFKVQGLVKGNTCRLLISLEDSGKGIETDQLEELLSNTKENDLGMSKKIINILGGNLIVTSNIGVGTKVNIVLDQEIQTKNKEELDKYETDYFDKKNILVLGCSLEERKQFMREVDEYGGIIETVETINEVIEKINKHKRYCAVIIDGDIKYHTIKQIVERLKNIKGFNSNIVVCSKDKEMKSSKNRAIIGVQGYIARPIVDNALLDTLNSLDK